MTAPDLQFDVGELRLLVGPAAWRAHNALPEEERVDIELAYRVYGSLTLVAADILEVVCHAAKRGATSGGQQVKRLKDGTDELEFFQAASAEAVDASTWCDKADRFRLEAKATQSVTAHANPEPLLDPWGLA